MFKVFIQKQDFTDSVSIYFVEENDGKRFYAKPINLEFEHMEEGSEIQPTLHLHGMMAGSFLKSFAEVLDKNGIKTDKDAKIEGTLEATRFHLDDLRILLKLKK